MSNTPFEVLWEDAEHLVRRRLRTCANGARDAVLEVLLVAEHPTPGSLDRVSHEYQLKDELDDAWAARPLELVRTSGQTTLLLKDPGGEPLDRLIGPPMEIGIFLRLAVALAAALGGLHDRGLIHKDIKPTNVLVNSVTDRAWLTGFGIASRLLRERQSPEPPEFIAGTLAYMAPEQTGRMNRSIDSRSDLYSLGVTLYEMITGTPPFTASDPMEWIHCHIARMPAPPGERVQNVPAPVSAIILKLLAKTAEERYQTAAGVESDLRRCLAEWETAGRIEPFALGEGDVPSRLVIPEKLYGREREIATLLAAFDRVVNDGTPRLVLVSGYSGIGKSSVVNELHKVLVPPDGLFASGKFDQYQRDIPYATLAQAFQSLVRQLLSKSEVELRSWRAAFREALGPNGKLMVDLVPELKLIVGEQPPVPELPPQQAQSRFQLVFRRFLGVFASADHPLALFLDDLQWLDAATLDLLEDLLNRSDLHHLLLIGAYRDNEVDSDHPLVRKLEVIKTAGAKVEEITLAPLASEELGRLIADTLRCDPERAAPLAHLVRTKTAGNPFFVIQFLYALAEEKLLALDHDEACWAWDLERIQAKGYTDNVVELMIAKLTRLPLESQKALQALACLGNVATAATLSIVHCTPEQNVHADLWEAVRLELVERRAESYRFVHDRVHEAAYSLIAKQSRAEAHLRIGRLLAAHTPAEEREGSVFEVVNQLNRGASLITSRGEREQVAELNLLAGKRAKASTAYVSALNHLIAGAALLGDDCWERRRDLTFALELERAECEFLTGELATADKRLTALSKRAANTVERAIVACLRMDVCATLDQSDRAIAVALDYLQHVGIDWSSHPTEEEARREYEQIWRQLGSRAIEDIIDLPLMSDPEALATVDVLAETSPPALFTDSNLAALTVCRAVNLSIERGNCDASCFAYVVLGRIAGPRFGDYKAGFRFGQVGYELVERRGLKRFHAKTYLAFVTFIMRWKKHVSSCHELLRRGFEAANRMGDLTCAAYACNNLNSNLLFAGDPLAEVQREAERGLAFAQKTRYGLVIDAITTQLALIRTLRGLTPIFGRLDDERIEEIPFEQYLSGNPVLAITECWYWIRKLQARYLAGDSAAAMEASSRAQRLLWTSVLFFEEAEYHFYSALARAERCDCGPAGDRQQHLGSLAAHHGQLAVWAENCPENFDNRVALVGAEIARIEGRDVDAMHLYEQAIRSAHAGGFVHHEAIADEVAARFYMARGFDKIAHLYLRDARDCYLRWGADGKVRQLDKLYPYLRQGTRQPDATSTISTSVEQLDLATVIKLSQAISGEIVLDKLIDALMRTAIEHAGAERGLLILARGEEYRIVAEATASSGTVAVGPRQGTVTAADLPVSVLHYVARTKESVLLHDASVENQFAADDYILGHHARSILGLPLLKDARLVGVLYLENNLALRVFTRDRTVVLKLLASQAAISLENVQLYADLQEREARVRRLVDSNIVGIFIWGPEGLITDANEAFLGILGYSREELISRRMSWRDLTPVEWQYADDKRVEQLKATGIAQPYEKEYVQKSGKRVPVLVGAANFGERWDEGVGFVVDLTERKEAEKVARETERRYREVQMELAHANRVATMGQLSASIAHEINQPIGAVVTNAQAAVRWLDAQPPDIEEVREALGRIVREGNRASNVMDRIRALVKKAPPRKARLEINEAIRQVIALTHGEAVKNRVLVQTRLSEALPLVHGDQVQLQQVVLNLMINAVEAMSVGEGSRELLISTARANSHEVLVTVQDSGPGLPSPERVFDAFYTTKPGGLGIGLSICRSIIDAHGGRLWASANEPRGARFQFSLPEHPEGTSPVH